MNYLTLLLRFRTRNENKTRKKRGLAVFHELAKSVKRNYTVPYKFNLTQQIKKKNTDNNNNNKPCSQKFFQDELYHG